MGCPQTNSLTPNARAAVASAYQPRRVRAAAASVALNLAFAGLFVASGLAERLWTFLSDSAIPQHWALALVSYLLVYFAVYALLNFPMDLWFGYLQDRQFGLAKDGIRASGRDWLFGMAWQATLFVPGCTLLILTQRFGPELWPAAMAAILLVLFGATSFLGPMLLPAELFQMDPADAQVMGHLRALLGERAAELPRLLVYSAPSQREFNGGLVGIGRRQVLLISRATIELASDDVLRFVLLHELGHRRYRHLGLATLTAWAWACAGLLMADRLIPDALQGTGLYVAHVAFWFTLWMVVTEPLLAYLGRRLELQADRYYLRCGGTLAAMEAALAELSSRNIARTDALSRRESILRPLPTVPARLDAARRAMGRIAAEAPRSRVPEEH